MGNDTYCPCCMTTIYDMTFLVTVKAAPHECVIRTGQPKT